uniref:hypothetical protein n=1 Tax=Petrachloros mirabilis TaxID=2918835 RepID=UPI0030840BB5
MLPAKAVKVDLDAVYPCPCRRQGSLLPIALTEAFGCDRCQQIFVIKPDGHTLEQLSGHYPYKRLWYWNGQNWQALRQKTGEQLWVFGLGLAFLVVLPLIFWLLLAFQMRFSEDLVLWLFVTATLMICLFFVSWSFWARR